MSKQPHRRPNRWSKNSIVCSASWSIRRRRSVDEQTRVLRERLIHEEFEELKEAMGKNDLFAVAKELADLLYVVYGTAVSYGIDMEPVFREVHRSNMSKVGGYKREDGKWVKPATYSPAVIEPILTEQQGNRGRERTSQSPAETKSGA